MKLSFKIALVTASSLISCTLWGELPTQAATFAEAFAFIRLSDFSLTPQNPDADSIRDSIAFTGSEDSTVDANADGTLSFIIDENNDTVIDLDFQTDVTGDGDNYFGVGDAFSFTSSSFLIAENETLSFDFEVDLFLRNIVDSVEDGSVSNFSGVRFSLLDNSDDSFLGGFLAQGNLTTNLLDFDNDFLFADATDNVRFDGSGDPGFGGNQEFGAINLSGNFSQTFTTDTEVRLEVSSLNLTCSQATQTNDPCTKVPEPNSILTLIVGFIGLGLWKVTKSKPVDKLEVTANR
ncbi:MAG: hypothetical protein QNJ32_15480 [Xenococcaceae cyanobacterium MO_167.B27]|nr:hypothetical protein [Xenococcaceae cyanobacterium MO_167.B27]